jgi:hypothetical protein
MHTSHFSHKKPLKQLKKRKHIWVMPWLIDFILAKNCLIFDEKSYIDIRYEDVTLTPDNHG